jgi:5-oxoprolinase (ATP-hydrolysing) subunit A
MPKVDLNCDMGESFSLYKLGHDEEMMKYITSANIACGYHAGDPHVMRETVQLAKEYGVALGAHPSFPDPIGFGRRHLNCTPREVKDYILYQMGALREFARVYDVKVEHVKPHGALYMMAMEDEELAEALVEAIAETDEEVVLFALNNSAVVEKGRKKGIPVAREVFADREHTPTGSIILTRKGSEIKDTVGLAQRVVRMVKEGKVETHNGETVSIVADTVCIHGDTPGAPDLAREIVRQLKEEHIDLVPARQVIL